MSIFTLRPDEETVYEKWGSYVKKTFITPVSDNAMVEVTNQRIGARYKTIIAQSKENALEVELKDVESVQKCLFVGIGIVPMCVKLKMKNGDVHYFSVMNRNTLIDEISKRIN